MRTIKFKGWNKSAAHPYMVDIEQVTYDESGELSCISGFAVDSDNGGEVILLEGQFDLMQFTGLQDKNGVDIYESDIVKTDRENNYIVWRDDMALFAMRVSKLHATTSIPKDTEVIGNKFESPELLEQ